MSLLSCDMDVRTGGAYRFVFSHPAFDQPMAFFGTYREVTPNKRLVWTNEESDQGAVTTVTFEENAGKTLVTLHELYPTNGGPRRSPRRFGGRPARTVRAAGGVARRQIVTTPPPPAYGRDNDDIREQTRFPKDCHSDRSADCNPSRSAKETPTMSKENFADVQWPAYLLQRAWRRQAAHSSSRGHQPDSFGSNLAELAKGRQVIAVHLQAHGRTPDTDRPLRCETMGDDVAALIGHLKTRQGRRDGYLAGLLRRAADRHPPSGRVDRLVLMAARMRQDDAYRRWWRLFNQLEANAAMLGGSVKASPLGQAYSRCRLDEPLPQGRGPDQAPL